MTRFRADICLLFVAMIWGTAFIAQKSGMNGIGPFTFVTCRFFLSLVVVLPFCINEWKRRPQPTKKDWVDMLPLCLACAVGVCLQQVGLSGTSVVNAGFITSLYVVFTPFMAWLVFRKPPSAAIVPASLTACFGLYYLNGGTLTELSTHDALILLCAICYACHVAFTGWYLARHDRPILVSAAQYCVTMILGATGAAVFETVSFNMIMTNICAILYAGIISGGLAYTLQAIAQRHTPPANAALILSTEAIFAAIAGMVFLSEAVTAVKFIGCCFIIGAIFIMEMKAETLRKFFKKR